MKTHLKTLALLAVICATPVQAGLLNRYSFNDGTANDSVGAANGTLVGSNGSISGGSLILDNTGESSANPGPDGAYLDLPNGLITSAANADTAGALTIEMWITMAEHRDWSAAFSAGTSINGEDTSDCCNGDQPYLQIIPRTGDGGAGNDFRVTTNNFGAGEGFVDEPGDGTDLQIGVEEHLVAVFDQSAGTPGDLTVYRNGVLVGVAGISANLDLTTFLRADLTGGDVNNWIGRSQWPDALLDASVNEVRIYGNALTAANAANNFAAGPNTVVPEPSALMLVSLTGLLILKRRRSNA